MKILLIGHSIIDRFEGSENDSPKPGGLFYSTLGVLSAAQNNDLILALTSWNMESIGLFEKVYSQIDLSVANELVQIPEVILKTSGAGEREELYKNLSIPLSLEKISDWNSFDGILINMITGFDLSPEQMKTIRKMYNGIIYIDIHTLARGVDKNMKREFRTIPNSDEWLACADIVQANESELRTIIGLADEEMCAEKILDQGPEILIVTRGEKGANLYRRVGNYTERFSVESIKVNAVNKVGCGDIFGAVFFYSYISEKDVRLSLTFANKAGALAASTPGMTKFSKLNLL